MVFLFISTKHLTVPALCVILVFQCLVLYYLAIHDPPQPTIVHLTEPCLPCPHSSEPPPPPPPPLSLPTPPPLNADVLFHSYLRRMKKDYPAVNYERLLSKPMDVIIVWKIVMSDRWKVNTSFSSSEITAFLNFSFPTYRRCADCQFWLWTSFGPDMFSKELQTAFKQLNMDHFFYNPDAIAKLLLYKFFRNGRLLTFAVDNDDFVEQDFFAKVMADVHARFNTTTATTQVCYRPKEYLEFYPFETIPRVGPHHDPFPLRIMMGLFVQGLAYNDVLTMDHMKYGDRNYVDCDTTVHVNSSAFYTRRLESSSAALHTKAWVMESYEKGKEWSVEKGLYNLAF